MKERPILMSAPMVRALLAGTKTQTRMSIPGRYIDDAPPVHFHRYLREHCPYGVPGDRLWVRETWMDLCGTGIEPFTAARTHYAYGADTLPGSYGDECRKQYGLKWRPSIHMPRLASRITLEVTDVRVERLQEISEADAMAEGAKPYLLPVHPARESLRHVDGYAELWDSLNAKTHPWASNPYVWVLTFRRVQP